MLNVFMCTHDCSNVEKYCEMIESLSMQYDLPTNIECISYDENLDTLLEKPAVPDIIYMDTTGKMNGLELAKQLRARHCDAEIILLTNNTDQLYDSFAIKPMQYLIDSKLTFKRFAEVFMHAVCRVWVKHKKNSLFLHKSGNGLIVLPIRNIVFFKIHKRVVTVYYEDKERTFYSCMETLEKQMKEQNFIRTHRSYLVNLSYVSKIASNCIYLNSDESLPIGTTYLNKVKQAFHDYNVWTGIFKNKCC